MTATGECGGGVAEKQRNLVVFSFPKFKIIPTQLDRSLDPCYNNDMLVNNNDPVITQDTFVLYVYDIEYV